MITITLTNRRPVRINEDHWPYIAEGQWDDHDGQIRAQANREWHLWICVRQHADGRALVYGGYEYSSNFERERGFTAHAGVMLPGLLATPDRICTTIVDVGKTLADRLGDAKGNAAEGWAHVNAVVSGCIADMPPENLDEEPAPLHLVLDTTPPTNADRRADK
jgi:hypothetical protein